ncbi:MAG: hypothetical protein ACI9T7_001367 [Oleiphilaceae bacterium]|jgi:hypothetical protein
MNPLKLIRAFHRRVSYASTPKGRAKARQALCHLLRVVIKDSKTIEWQDDFSDSNLLWRPQKGVESLDALSPEEKIELVEEVNAPARIKNKTEMQRKRNQYKAKIKSAMASEGERGNELASVLMDVLLTTANNEQVEQWILETLKNTDMYRKNQRIKMLETYITAHNALVDSVPNENATYIQEGIFKIPHRWGVTTDLVSRESYITVVKDFLQANFPDYPIKLIAVHHDERLPDEDTGEYMDTGAHSHYVLSGQNEKTGAFDLNQAQAKAVKAYIKKIEPDKEYLPEDGKMTWTDSVYFGMYFQRMFYDYFNQHLLEPKGVRAGFADATERCCEQRKHTNRESVLPSLLREYSYNNALIEISAKRLNALKFEVEKTLDVKSLVDSELLTSNLNLQEKAKNIKEAHEIFQLLTHEIVIKEKSIANLEQTHDDLQSIAQHLSTVVGQHLSTLMKDVYVRIKYKQIGQDKQASQYLEKIVSRFNSHIPQELQPLVATILAQDDAVLYDSLVEVTEVSYE